MFEDYEGLFILDSPSRKYLGPTINFEEDEPLRRPWTPSANQLVENEITVSEIGKKSTVKAGFKFHCVTPEVIESDYYGTMSFTFSGGKHVHAIITNPGSPVTDLVLGTKNDFQFNGEFGKHVNRMILGMIYQWELSSLELLNAVVSQGLYLEEDIVKQKNWILDFLPGVFKTITEWHHLMPLPLMRKEHYTIYLGRIFDDGDKVEFLYNMVNCKKIDIVSFQCRNFRIGTRFDDDNERFFAFGY